MFPFSLSTRGKGKGGGGKKGGVRGKRRCKRFSGQVINKVNTINTVNIINFSNKKEGCFMKRIFYLTVFLVAVSVISAYALTPEEILLLKRAGVPDEKILEMQKKEGTAPPIAQINPFDWNADGKKDLLVGNSRGNVYIFFNIGNDSSPRFSDDGMKTPISVSGYATPFVADWNGDGKFDVICGSSDGRVYIFINEGTDKNPAFGKSQTLQVNNKELRLPSHTAVIAMDWDDDGKIDLLVSNRLLKNSHFVHMN